MPRRRRSQLFKRKSKRNTFTDGYGAKLPSKGLRIDRMFLAEFVPAGEDDPTQVHFHIYVEGKEDEPLIMRFKSPDSIGDLVEELNRYRNLVWPDAPPLDYKRGTGDELEPEAIDV